MRANETICDDCEVSRCSAKTVDTPHQVSRNDLVVTYRYEDGWTHVPLAGTGIDICPTCSAKKPNLTALTKKVRSR